MGKLAIIALSGLAISAVCLGAAAGIGADKFEHDGIDISFFSDRPRCETVAGATATSRVLDWDGSDRVTIGVPANVTYSPAGDGKLHVSGDPQTVAHVRVKDGSIELDCNNGWHGHDGRLEMTLPHVPFKKFGIAGSGKMVLEKLDQEKARFSIAGSGSIKADGKVDQAEIRIAGSGDADLGDVDSRKTEVHIAGSGNADIAPREEAEIHIAGSGDVNLHTNPPKVETHIAGSGRIHNVGGGI